MSPFEPHRSNQSKIAESVVRFFRRTRNVGIAPLHFLLVAMAFAAPLLYFNCDGQFKTTTSSLSPTGENGNASLFAIGGFPFGYAERLDIKPNGDLVLVGWACVVGGDGPDKVKVYTDMEILAEDVPTDIPRPDAASICVNDQNTYGFKYTISAQVRAAIGGGVAIHASLNGTELNYLNGPLLTPVTYSVSQPGRVNGALLTMQKKYDQSLFFQGWACEIGENSQVNIVLTTSDGTIVRDFNVANKPYDKDLSWECKISDDQDHGFSFSVPEEVWSKFASKRVVANVRFRDTTHLYPIAGTFVIPALSAQYSAPITAKFIPTEGFGTEEAGVYVGAGGSHWRHQVTLKSIESLNTATYQIYSSNENSNLIPSFMEHTQIVQSNFSGSPCYIVSSSSADNLKNSSLRYLIEIKACLTFLSIPPQNLAVDITFYKIVTKFINSIQQPPETSEHGVVQLRAPISR